MPRPKKITQSRINNILREIIDSKDKDAALKAIKTFMDVEKEMGVHKQLQRDRVTKRVVDDKALQNLIGFHPHKKQQEVLDCNNSDRVICAGRQGGKTLLCAYIALKALLEKNNAVCLIAPTYTLTERVMDYLKVWIAKYFKGEIRVVDKPTARIITKWDSYLEVKSAEKPEQILGKGYDLVIVDECARVTEKIYQTYITEASGVKLGKYLYISTPRGRDWFWKLWRKAKENKAGFSWTSLESPYFRKDKWDQVKKVLPEMIFNQEYRAEFMENAMVFQGLDGCLKEDLNFPQDFNDKHLYVMGVDLGKYEAFTTIAVMDLMTNQLVNFHRFQGDWKFQGERIRSVADKYGRCPIWIDATSVTVGDAYVEELADAGYSVYGYKIHSNISKRELVEKTVVLIQNTSITLPNKKNGTEESDELILEMRAFGYTISPAGLIRYNAPQGEYDDCVIALALACFELDAKPIAELESKGDQVITPLKDDF